MSLRWSGTRRQLSLEEDGESSTVTDRPTCVLTFNSGCKGMDQPSNQTRCGASCVAGESRTRRDTNVRLNSQNQYGNSVVLYNAQCASDGSSVEEDWLFTGASPPYMFTTLTSREG